MPRQNRSLRPHLFSSRNGVPYPGVLTLVAFKAEVVTVITGNFVVILQFMPSITEIELKCYAYVI